MDIRNNHVILTVKRKQFALLTGSKQERLPQYNEQMGP